MIYTTYFPEPGEGNADKEKGAKSDEVKSKKKKDGKKKKQSNK